MRNPVLLALCLAALPTSLSGQVAGPTAAPMPPYMRPISSDWMTRSEVVAMASRALDRCEALNLPATVSIVDAEGSLRITQSSDNARIVGIETSMTKIAAVLAFRESSRKLQERAAGDAVFAGDFSKDSRFLFYPGGLPIYRGKRFIGVIAVGGARDNDETCARAGLQALTGAGEAP